MSEIVLYWVFYVDGFEVMFVLYVVFVVVVDVWLFDGM